MSAPYDRYDRSQSSRSRSAWTTLVPLVALTAVAAVGVAAWAMGRHPGHDDTPGHDPDPVPVVEPEADLDYENGDYGDNPPYGRTDGPPAEPPRVECAGAPPGPADLVPPPPPRPGPVLPANTNWGFRAAGALRRTPSPSAILDSAGKTVAASMAAAGAVMGSALAAIREDDHTAFADHDSWSEEAALKDKTARTNPAPKRRKTVALVVSADGLAALDHEDPSVEQLSILSHIPRQNDFAAISIYVLLYTPGLTQDARPTPSLSSSYSIVGLEQPEPSLDGGKPTAPPPATTSYDAVFAHAYALVESKPMVLPFTAPASHTHMLRSLDPDVIYLQQSLAGPDGSLVAQLQTWFRHDIVIVVGAERGHAGLADSESEAEHSPAAGQSAWWQRPERIGRGRGVVVVDSMRVADDWARRVQGHD